MIPRKQPSVIATIIGVLIIAVFIALAFVVTPLLALVVGMAIGYVLEFVTGDYVINAFHIIGLNGVQDGDLPKVFGLLSLFAYFLKLGTIKTEKKAEVD